MLGIINKRPCEAVKVLVREPAAKEPCMAPAAPASDCISTTRTGWPKMFFCPFADHSSTYSAMGEDGVMGKMEATSVKA